MNKTIEALSRSNSIAITSHTDPDGDSIGSILALGLALKQKHKDIQILIKDSLPSRYKFLPGSDLIKKYDDIEERKFDLLFVLDCGDENRTGNNKILKNSKTIINIDHHISNTKFGDINIININSSSTCEMIFQVIKDLHLLINKEIAMCIYTGILTDSGNFMYDNANEKTHLIAAELLRTNFNKNKIIYNLYQRKSINSLKFIGYLLTNMEIALNGRLAIFKITLDLLNKFNVSYNNIESLVNYGRDMEGVQISIVIREQEDGSVKLSFRSKDDNVDVRALAQLFNGGGHKKASGATLNSSLIEAESMVIEKSKKILRW